MSNTEAVSIEATSTVEPDVPDEATSTVEPDVPDEAILTDQPLDEVGGASAKSETVMTEFSTKTRRDDLTLIVEDQRLHVCTYVLAFASPVFDAMFSDEFQEKGMQEITLPGKKFEDFVEFLKCIYPNILKPVTMDNVYKVLPLADEYQVQSLKSACEVAMLGYLSEMSCSDIYAMLEQACKYGLDQTQAKCIDIIAERPHEEFDKAATKATFPNDVQYKIKSKFLQTLSTKHKELGDRMKTSEVLNRYLGEMASQRDLVDQYLAGQVVGNYVQMKVNSQYNTSVVMSIGALRFSISLAQVYIMDYSSYCVQVTISCQTQCAIKCMSSVIIRNWMKGKDDATKVSTLQFNDKHVNKEISLDKVSTDSLEDETAGFMCKGTMDVLVYVFCIDG